MKAVFINGSPRKGWNTHKLLESAMRGAAENGYETELIHLGDIDYKGCRGCLVCKLKDSPANGLCVMRDDLRPVLERVMDADVLVIGSPVYFGDLTSDTLAFLERLRFPVLNYKLPVNGKRPRTLPKEKKLGFIIDMNVAENIIGPLGYKKYFSGLVKTYAELLGDGTCPILYACDTFQFDDYEKYDVTMFDVDAKLRQRENQFPIDLEKAYALGKSLTE